MAVNWDTWREVGMAVKTEMPAELEESRRESLARGIAPAEGADAFIRILNSRRPQVAVCTTDLPTNLASGGVLTTDKIEQEPPAVSGLERTAHPRPALATAYVPPRSETEEKVATIWQDLLGVAPIGVQDNFFELGGHSLLAIRLLSQLHGLFELQLSVQDLFDAPTVVKLSERIDANRDEAGELDTMACLLEQVEQLSESELRALLENGQALPDPGRRDAPGKRPSQGKGA
jgi:acyl carrier protein